MLLFLTAKFPFCYTSQVLQCEYAVRGEIVALAQVSTQLSYMRSSELLSLFSVIVTKKKALCCSKHHVHFFDFMPDLLAPLLAQKLQESVKKNPGSHPFDEVLPLNLFKFCFNEFSAG